MIYSLFVLRQTVAVKTNFETLKKAQTKSFFVHFSLATFSPKAYSSFHHQPRKTTTNSIKTNFTIKILFYGLFNNERRKFLLLKNVVVSLEFGNLKGSTTFMTGTLTALKSFLWRTKMKTKAEFMPSC